MDPFRAYRLATFNPADYWRLDGIGAVAPGYEANLNILTDFEEVTVESVLFQGQTVAYRGEMVIDLPENQPPEFLLDSMHWRTSRSNRSGSNRSTRRRPSWSTTARSLPKCKR